MADISELLRDQPLIDENDGGENDQVDEVLDTGGADINDDPPDDGGEQPPQRNQKVPLAALHEERAKRQQYEADLQMERDRSNKLQERFNQFLLDQQKPQAPAAAPEAPPSFEDDPVAAFNYVQKQLQDQQRIIQEYQQGTTQQVQQQQAHQQLTQQAVALEAEYVKTAPDYHQAFDHFVATKVREYSAFTDEATAQRQVASDCARIAQLAISQGKNPAALIHQAAKNLGYVPGKPQQQQRKEAPTSLSTVQGSARAPDEQGKITAQDIGNMNDAEFEKFFNEMARKGVQRPKV